MQGLGWLHMDEKEGRDDDDVYERWLDYIGKRKDVLKARDE
jgi:hypothetical protein